MIGSAKMMADGASFVRPDGTSLYELALGRDGILRVRTVGLWSLGDAETYLADLGRTVARARGPSGGARVLLDLRAASVQSAEVIERLSLGDGTVFNPRDWRAFVVESRLRMMQLRRGIIFAGTQVFASPVDAERWLRDRD